MGNIDWPEATKILLTAVASAVFTGVLAFLTQKLVERWLLKSLEKFKTDLQRASFEHQTRFSKLHEKRAEATAELYQRLARAQRSLTHLMLLLVPQKESRVMELYRSAFKDVNAFFEYFDEHRLYFPTGLCTKLEKLHQTFVGAYSDFIQAKPNDISEQPEVSDQFKQVLNVIADKIPKIRQDIEDEFRTMLGKFDELTNDNLNNTA